MNLQSPTMKAVSLVLMAAMILQLATAKNYTVGDPDGSWDYITDLREWASSKHFKVGDILVFDYSSDMHNLLEVTMANYNSCNARKPILMDESGYIEIKLKKVGKRYFICGIKGHCAHGMKMEVDVK